MQHPLSKKQLEFVVHSTATWNIAHGSVRSGKTIGCIFRFMQALDKCPEKKVYISGHTFDTAFRNVVQPILNSPELAIFAPFCNWSGKKLYYKDKIVTLLGAKDEGAVKNFQGDTYPLIYCNEIALYPRSIIEMIDTRLSRDYSLAFAECNPEHPDHIIKQWIDKAANGDPKYYALHFRLEDNPFLSSDYISRIKHSLTGVYYKRYYLGEWCMAEGAIFDYFDKSVYVVDEPPAAAEYWIAGIDYGTSNAFSCVLIGISTGRYTQTGVKRWVEKEYVWDSKKRGRQKTSSEYADDVQEFLEPYGVKQIYIDPSALSFKLDLQRRGMHVIEADNDVLNGINYLSSELYRGNLFICKDCPNLIREIEGYVWDAKAAKEGKDKPLKKEDHSIDATRYAVFSHKVVSYNPYKQNEMQADWMRNKYEVTRNF